jgi:tetratricopeptide (TPR) repeat protein
VPQQHDVVQIARGNYIAQAAPGGTATVVHYEFAPAAPVDDEALARAARLLEQLPTDRTSAAGAVPAGSRMPLGPNPLFVGRESELRRLAESLKGDQPGTDSRRLTAAVTGFPGAGKTQLCSEFVHRYGQYFAGGVYWVSFADPSAVESEVAACGAAGWMALRPDFTTLPLEERTRLVMSAWQSELPRLLVFDNCEDEQLVFAWSPPSGGCRVLVSSRRQEWNPALAIDVVQLEALSPTEGVTLLHRYRPSLTEAEPAVAEIVLELGGLPLALHLAGSYLWRYRQAISPENYLAQLRQPDLLAHRSLTDGGLSPTGHEQGVARSFAVSYDQLDPALPTDARAAYLLACAAHLAPGIIIPRTVITGAAPQPRTEGDELQAGLDAVDAIARLAELGLLQLSPDGGIRLHRLLSAYVRAAADIAGTREAVADQLISEFARLEETGNLLYASGMEPHLRTVTDQALEQASDKRTAALCNALGRHLTSRGNHAEAVSYFQHGLGCALTVVGEDCPALARDLNDLGWALLRAGALEPARDCLEAALPRWKQLGDDANYAATLDNLGQVARDEGKLGEAESYFASALSIREQVLDSLDPRIAVTLTNLGQLRMQRQDGVAAVEYYRRALAIRLQKLGPRHPATAITLMSEAQAQLLIGDLDNAHRAIESAVAAYTATLGDSDPRTLTALAVQAQVVAGLGDSERTNELLERLESMREPLTQVPTRGIASALNTVGFIHWTDGNFAAACAWYVDAQHAYEEVEGPRHPDLIVVLNNLGMVWEWLDERGTAREAYECALEILEQSEGSATELGGRVRNNYGALLTAERELTVARAQLDQAYAVRVSVLGKEHPETGLTLGKLGLLVSAEGRPREGAECTAKAVSIARRAPDGRQILARTLHDHGLVLRAAHLSAEASAAFAEALNIRETAVNPLHPYTAATLTELADVAADAGDRVAALRYLERAFRICKARLGIGLNGELFQHSLTHRVQAALANLETKR